MRANILHRNEKEIIRILFREGIPLSVHEIADLSGMAWVTAKKYLKEIQKRHIVVSDRIDKRVKFTLNRELLKILYERKNETN